MAAYLLQPVACEHVEKSRQGILTAAAAAPAGQMLVLGAGECSEIPLAALASRSQSVTLCDVDAAAMQRGVDSAGLSVAARQNVSLQPLDLTGITSVVLNQIEAIGPSTAPAAFIDAMAGLLEAAEPLPLPSAVEGPYDLIVASCLLSQLHFGLASGGREAFKRRFPQNHGALESPRWIAALGGMARRMEATLLDEMLRVLAPRGRIYLSESVQVAFIRLHPSGQWQTEGTYRMLRTQDLSDYLDARFAIEARDRWHWVVWPRQETGLSGRLFDVQAVVLRAGRD